MVSVFCVVSLLAARVLEPSGVFSARVVMPDRFEARAGEALALSVQNASGEGLAWASCPTTWVFVRVAGTQENMEKLGGAEGEGKAEVKGGAVGLALETPGVTMIGVEFEPVMLRVTREQLEATLAGMVSDAQRDAVLKGTPEGKAIGVRFTSSAKTLVRVLGADGNPAAVDAPQTVGSKSGQFNEIRVLLDPMNSLVGGDVSVRLHADYDKSAGTRLFATNLDTGATQEGVSDSSGIAFYQLGEPGRWRLTFAAARLAPPGDDAAVLVHTASLTFSATRTEAPR